MELGHLVWFASRKRPFAVRERHCLDLQCSCTDAWLTFTEVDLEGQALPEPLTFEIQVDLRNGRERKSSRRPPEIQALVREFLVRFPAQRFEEMIERREEQRMIRQRLEEYRLDPATRGELLGYSELIDSEGGVAQNGRRFSFFFLHEGRDYLIEDHYCPNPACDCRTVHVEFWERTEVPGRTLKVELRRRLVARFTLDGELEQIMACEEAPQAGQQLALAWHDRCGDQFETFRERYAQVKAIGRHSMPSDIPRARTENMAKHADPEPRDAAPAGMRAGRNDPCPCGSGLKFKRCCGRG